MTFSVSRLTCVILLAACSRELSPSPEAREKAPVTSANVAPSVGSVTRKATFLEAEGGSEPVALVVKRERERIERGGGRLIVAVGAPWCEPCRRFHAAVSQGKLDAALPGIVFLEFDHDRDEDRLAAAGYTSKLIPLYVVPEASGRAPSDPRMRLEGSIKGEGAVAEITPRLLRLLDEGAR